MHHAALLATRCAMWQHATVSPVAFVERTAQRAPSRLATAPNPFCRRYKSTQQTSGRRLRSPPRAANANAAEFARRRRSTARTLRAFTAHGGTRGGTTLNRRSPGRAPRVPLARRLRGGTLLRRAPGAHAVRHAALTPHSRGTPRLTHAALTRDSRGAHAGLTRDSRCGGRRGGARRPAAPPTGQRKLRTPNGRAPAQLRRARIDDR